MDKRKIFGLSAALITPFTENGSVDLARLVSHARFVLKGGCDSVTLFGTTGEGFSIGMRERAAMLGAVCGAGLDPSHEIYAGVSATNVADGVEQARLALDAGVRGLLMAPPYYFKAPTDDGLFAWFSELLNSIGASAREVILYNIPSQTAVALSVDLVGRLKQAFPGVISGVKDSSGDWSSTEAYLAAHGELAILVGDERQLAKAMPKGAQGSICGVANIAPELLSAIIHRGEDNQLLVPIVDLIVSYPVMPAVKALVAHLHGDAAYARTRAPLADLDAASARQLIAAYDAIYSPEPERLRA